MKGVGVALTAEQQWMIATIYEKAAGDSMNVPAPQRAAFARKAKRFRTLARIAAKIEATAVVKESKRSPPLRTSVAPTPFSSDWEWQPQAKYRTLAEQLAAAQATTSSPSQDKRGA
jgi:hypothetical protein